MFPQIVLTLCDLILCKVVGRFYIFVNWHCGCKIYTNKQVVSTFEISAEFSSFRSDKFSISEESFTKEVMILIRQYSNLYKHVGAWWGRGSLSIQIFFNNFSLSKPRTTCNQLLDFIKVSLLSLIKISFVSK